MMKVCFKCGGDPQPLSAFYKHPQMADGHLNKCKECTKRDTKATVAADPEKRAAYERERWKRPERKKAVNDSVKAARERDPKRFAEYGYAYAERNRLKKAEKARLDRKENPSKKASQNRAYDAANPEKRRAHRRVRRAKASGVLEVRPCEGCKGIKNVQAHHDDYTKPLEVRWLCPKCHGIEHRMVGT